MDIKTHVKYHDSHLIVYTHFKVVFNQHINFVDLNASVSECM